VLDEVDWASSRLDAASWAGLVLFSNGGHFDELKEALGAALPVLLAAVGLSLLLLVLAALPPSMLPEGALADFLAERRGQVALVGVAISLSAAIVVGIVFWAL
jgi:hypothetical protein